MCRHSQRYVMFVTILHWPRQYDQSIGATEKRRFEQDLVGGDLTQRLRNEARPGISSGFTPDSCGAVPCRTAPRAVAGVGARGTWRGHSIAVELPAQSARHFRFVLQETAPNSARHPAPSALARCLRRNRLGQKKVRQHFCWRTSRCGKRDAGLAPILTAA